MKGTILPAFTVALLCGNALAAPQAFDFKDPKGVNNAVFKLDAPLEAINGSANGITGTVTFDPENPSATKGRIVVASSWLHVPNPMMKEHLHGAQWLDVAKYPEITFEAKEFKQVKTDAGNTTAEVTGTLTLSRNNSQKSEYTACGSVRKPDTIDDYANYHCHRAHDSLSD